MQRAPGAREAMHERVSIDSRLQRCDLLRDLGLRPIRKFLDVDGFVRAETEHIEARRRVHRERRALFQRDARRGKRQDEVAVLHAEVDGAELGDGVDLRSSGRISRFTW